MKKYVRLLCDTCQRTADRAVDNSRVTPDRCTITLNCQGRLFPVEYRSNGEITTAPKVGTTDWYPRGQTLTSAGASAVRAPNFINTSTGSLKQVVLGVRLPSDPAPTAKATLNLASRAEKPKEYKQYIFRKSTEFSTISGVEDGISKKTLRFTAWGANPDIVEVYLNGAKAELGTAPDQFQVDDGSANPPAPSNTIKFNTPVLPVGTYQIDVIVSKAQASDVYTLEFTRNQEDPNRNGAWDNVSFVERFNGATWDKFFLFTLDLAEDTVLKKDSILFPEGSVFVDGAGSVPLADCVMFLARKPFTKVDRYPDISVPLDTLGPDRDYFKYHLADGELALQVTDTSLQTFFPPSRVSKFDTEGTIKTIVAGNTEQLVVDGSVIVGPDT